MQKAKKMYNQTFEQARTRNHPSPILSPANTVVTVRPIEFVARDKCKMGGTVQIWGFWGDFEEWFLGKVEKLAQQPIETTLRYQTLLRNSTTDSIITELGGEVRAETSLGEMWSLLEKQPNGEDGALPTDGRHSSLCHAKDEKGVLRALNFYWRKDGWLVGAFSFGTLMDSRHRWDAGCRVFSPDLDP
jgi:hypothetical protein